MRCEKREVQSASDETCDVPWSHGRTERMAGRIHGVFDDAAPATIRCACYDAVCCPTTTACSSPAADEQQMSSSLQQQVHCAQQAGQMRAGRFAAKRRPRR